MVWKMLANKSILVSNELTPKGAESFRGRVRWFESFLLVERQTLLFTDLETSLGEG